MRIQGVKEKMRRIRPGIPRTIIPPRPAKLKTASFWGPLDTWVLPPTKIENLAALERRVSVTENLTLKHVRDGVMQASSILPPWMGSLNA